MNFTAVAILCCRRNISAHDPCNWTANLRDADSNWTIPETPSGSCPWPPSNAQCQTLLTGEFGIRTRALNTAFFDNPQCGFYFVGSILKRSWVPNCHLKLRGKAIDILPLGARLKKYGH